MTTGTKSGLSKDGAVRSKVASSNFHVGDQSCQRLRQISRRFFSRPARPRSVLKYHWYQYARSCAAGADGDGALAAVGLVGDLEGGRADGQDVRHRDGHDTRGGRMARRAQSWPKKTRYSDFRTRSRARSSTAPGSISTSAVTEAICSS